MAKGQEPRQFSTGVPVIRISDSTSHAVVRTISFDIQDNAPLLESFDWAEHHQVPPTEVESGAIYTHVDGARLRARMTWSYWHPDYQPWKQVQGATFTEHDYQWLKLAQIGAGYDLEFFPFEEIPQGTPPSNLFQAHIVSLTRTRNEANVYVWECALEVQGVNVRTNIPVY